MWRHGRSIVLRNRTADEQHEVLKFAKQLFLNRYADGDVVYENLHQPKDILEGWEDCLLIADQLLGMYWDRCQ